MALAFSREQKNKGNDKINDVLDVSIDQKSILLKYEWPINERFDTKFEDFLKNASTDLSLLKLDERDFAQAIDAYFDSGTVFDELVNFVVDTAEEYATATDDLKRELQNLDLEITKDGLDKVLAREVNNDADKRYINAFVYRYVEYIKQGGESVSVLTQELAKLFDNPSGTTHFVVADDGGNLNPWTIRKNDLATRFSDLNSGWDYVFSHVVFDTNGRVQAIVLKAQGLLVDVANFEASCADHNLSYQQYEVVRNRLSPVCLTCSQDSEPVRPNQPWDSPDDVSDPTDRQVEYIPENTGNKYIEYTHFCPDLPLQWDGSGFDRNQRGDVRLDRNPDRAQRKAVKRLTKYYGEISSQVDYYHDLPVNLGLWDMTETTYDRKALKTFKRWMRALGNQVVPILAQYDALYNQWLLQPYFDAEYNIAVQEYEEMKSDAEKWGRTAAERRALRDKKAELRRLKKSIKWDYKDHQRSLKDMYKSPEWEALLEENRISKREARLLYEMGEDYVRYRENQSQYPVYKRLIGLIEVRAKWENESMTYGDGDWYTDKENMGMLWNRVHDMDASLQAKDNVDADLDDEFGVGKTIRKRSRAYEALTGTEISREDRKTMKYYAGRERVNANSLTRLGKRTKPGEPLYMLVEARVQGMTVDQAYDAWILTNAIKIRYEWFQTEFDSGYDVTAVCDHGDAGKADLLAWQEVYQRGINHRLIIQMLSDFNLDGYVKHSDSGEKSGLQISNSFWAAVADMRLDSAFAQNDQPDHSDTAFMIGREGQALCNMISYMQKQFEARWLGHLLAGNYLQWLTPETAYVLRNRMKQSPALIRAMQDVLKNSSIDLVDIFRYGGEAASKSIELEQDLTVYFNDKVSEWMSSLDGRFGEISENLTAEQKRLWNEYRNHIQGGLISALYRAAEEWKDPYTLAAALQPDLVLADWGSGQLDLLINLWATLNGDVADMSTHTVNPLAAGALSVNQRLGRGASVHGTGGFWLAGWYISTGIRIRLGGNEDKVVKTLREKGLKETRLTADAFLINGIPGGRVGIDASRDMPAWLNEQYDVHQETYKKVFTDVLSQIDLAPVVSKSNRVKVAGILRKYFPDFAKLSAEQQDKRVETLLYDVAQYSASFTASGSKEHISTRLSEHYALQVRNYLFQEGKASHYHWSGVSVWAGIIGSIPFVDASIGRKSYGRYTWQDTLVSKLAAKTAEWRWTGDMAIWLWTPDFVDYMNDQLFGLPAMQSYLHLAKPTVESIVVKDGMVIVPRSAWESGRCNLKVNKLMKGHIALYDYDGDGTSDSYAFSDAVGMRRQRFLYESHLGFVLNVWYPEQWVDPQDVIEVRNGVDLPSDFLVNDPRALPDTIPEGLWGAVEWSRDVVTTKNIWDAIKNFEQGSSVDLFDETSVVQLPSGWFIVDLLSGWNITIEANSDLKIVKNADGSYSNSSIPGWNNGFDIIYLPNGVDGSDPQSHFAAIKSKIEWDAYLHSKILVEQADLSASPPTMSIKDKATNAVVVTIPLQWHYKLVDTAWVLSLETVNDNASGFVLETGVPCEYPVSLHYDDAWGARWQKIEDATYEWKVTQKNTYAFTLYELQNHQSDYVAFREAMDTGDVDEAFAKAISLMRAIGSADHVSHLTDVASRPDMRYKAEVLSYYEWLLCSVAAVRQVGRNSFKLWWKGAGNTFGDLVRSRESWLRRHLGKDGDFLASNIDDFMSSIKQALNLNIDKRDQADASNLDGIGLVLGYNAIDNVKTGIAEKFVTKPLVFGDAKTALDVGDKVYLKEYFLNTLLDSSVQSHLLDGLRSQLDWLKAGLWNSMKDLLLGKTIDGYSISWELVLTFFGRCCNETLIMRNMKIHAPCGESLSVPVGQWNPQEYSGGSTPQETYNVQHYVNHGESTNEMIATQRKQVWFGFGFAYADRGAPVRNPKTDPGGPPGRDPVTDPGTGPVRPPRDPKTDPNHVIRRRK